MLSLRLFEYVKHDGIRPLTGDDTGVATRVTRGAMS